MLTHLKLTMRVLRMPMHLSSGHVTLLSGTFHSPPFKLLSLQSDLRRRANSGPSRRGRE